MNITAYSTALFSTWYFIEELGLLFDAGDGVCAGLLQKTGKIKHVFISHADRDHLTGLLQLNQLNARGKWPMIYYPKDCQSFPYLAAFSSKFDTHVTAERWIGLEENEEIFINKNTAVKPIHNEHVKRKEGQIKSFSFHVQRIKRKLKPEYTQLKGKEIKALREKLGKEAITQEIRETLLSYSGDTPVEWDGRWENSQILIHEATFLHKSEMDENDARYNKHSTLEEVLEMIATTKVKTLILGHFSSRYSSKEIDETILSYCKRYQLKIPVYCVLPGQVARNILSGNPINHQQLWTIETS